MPRDSLEEIRIVRKDFFIVGTLLFNAFSWLYVTNNFILDGVFKNLRVSDANVSWAIYFGAIIGSGVVGSILSNKIRRSNLIYSWIIFGVVTALLTALLQNFSISSLTLTLVISLLFGVSSGLGLPSCLAYFADCTFVENRGRISGIVFLITNLSAPIFLVLFGMANLILKMIILAVWKALVLIIFFFMNLNKPEEEATLGMKKSVSFASIFHNRNFILFFVVWLIFCSIDRFEVPIVAEVYSTVLFAPPAMLGPILGSLSSFIGGSLCDRVGRKRIILYGFLSMGVAFSIISLAPSSLFSWYIYLVIYSTAGGFLWVTFILVLWGDLSHSGSREKYFVIGSTPFYMTEIIRVFSASYIELIPVVNAFSLASFFLFLAVLPLLYAPETLPEKVIQKKRIQKYLEAAKKIKKKYEKDSYN